MMYLKSLASAVPDSHFTQREIWELLRSQPLESVLKPRSIDLLGKILCGDSGIEKRHFVLPQPMQLLAMDAQQLNAAYERSAPNLASQAVRKALNHVAMPAEDLDALLVSSCTGYLCPGLSSHVAEQSGMRCDAFIQDVTGFGCGAAIPMWRVAEGLLAANPDWRIATVAVEACSLAFYLNDEPGVLISACLFGDGAAAAIWGGQGDVGEWHAKNFRTLHRPDIREKIRFVNERGFLKNQLARDVPELAAEAVTALWHQRTGEPDAVISHGGGRDVIEALERVFERDLLESREVMENYGNCSSPSVMMALESYLAKAQGAKALWLTSFGAGFAAHSVELER